MLAATLVPEHCSSGHCGKLCRWSHLISSAKGQRNCRPILQAVSYYLICQVLVVPSSVISRLARKIETAATAEESSGCYHPCRLMLPDCAPRRGLSPRCVCRVSKGGLQWSATPHCTSSLVGVMARSTARLIKPTRARPERPPSAQSEVAAFFRRRGRARTHVQDLHDGGRGHHPSTARTGSHEPAKSLHKADGDEIQSPSTALAFVSVTVGPHSQRCRRPSWPRKVPDAGS
jgi:hypothetical protein